MKQHHRRGSAAALHLQGARLVAGELETPLADRAHVLFLLALADVTPWALSYEFLSHSDDNSWFDRGGRAEG